MTSCFRSVRKYEGFLSVLSLLMRSKVQTVGLISFLHQASMTTDNEINCNCDNKISCNCDSVPNMLSDRNDNPSCLDSAILQMGPLGGWREEQPSKSSAVKTVNDWLLGALERRSKTNRLSSRV